MQSPMCGTCPYFRRAEIDNHGTCHVRPPTTRNSGFAVWPVVGYWEFCAEHPRAARTRTADLLALIAYRMRPTGDDRVMHVSPDDEFFGN